jgi:hypothetical protein
MADEHDVELVDDTVGADAQLALELREAVVHRDELFAQALASGLVDAEVAAGEHEVRLGGGALPERVRGVLGDQPEQRLGPQGVAGLPPSRHRAARDVERRARPVVRLERAAARRAADDLEQAGVGERAHVVAHPRKRDLEALGQLLRAHRPVDRLDVGAQAQRMHERLESCEIAGAGGRLPRVRCVVVSHVPSRATGRRARRRDRPRTPRG